MANIPTEVAGGLVQLIDTIASRGSFKGEELMPVATMRQNLIDALKIEQEEAKAKQKAESKK